MKTVRLAALWTLGGVAGLTLIICLVNSVLALALFGPAEGVHRLRADWERILVAHQMTAEALSVDAAFQRVYGGDFGPEPTADQIHRYISRDLEADEPAVIDALLALYIHERFGAVDGRTVPAGVYLAAGPIGPNAWPGPLASHYLVFPRHGYLLVVPPKRGGDWPTAYEATASLRQEFRSSGDMDALYAEVQPYRPGAYDFPRPGEPVHDLVLLTADPAEIGRIEARLSSFSHRLDARSLSYKLLRRNSNSALACYLQVVGLAETVTSTVGARLLLRLRLPGLALGERLPC